jgi:hypothetical protein
MLAGLAMHFIEFVLTFVIGAPPTSCGHIPGSPSPTALTGAAEARTGSGGGGVGVAPRRHESRADDAEAEGGVESPTGEEQEEEADAAATGDTVVGRLASVSSPSGSSGSATASMAGLALKHSVVSGVAAETAALTRRRQELEKEKLAAWEKAMSVYMVEFGITVHSVFIVSVGGAPVGPTPTVCGAREGW